MNCKYCNIKYKNKRALVQHEIRCTSNPNKINTKRSEETKQKIRNTFKEKHIVNKVIWTSEMKMNASERSKFINSEYWNDKTRKQQSNRMKQIVIDNPDSYSCSNVSGRVKIYNHNGFKLKGKWELLVAGMLDINNIKWTNIVKPIQYLWNGNWHSYFPDFYLEDLNLLVEVKGYKTDRDVQKWKYVKSPFIVLTSIEINDLRKNDKNILKYIAGWTGDGPSLVS